MLSSVKVLIRDSWRDEKCEVGGGGEGKRGTFSCERQTSYRVSLSHSIIHSRGVLQAVIKQSSLWRRKWTVEVLEKYNWWVVVGVLFHSQDDPRYRYVYILFISSIISLLLIILHILLSPACWNKWSHQCVLGSPTGWKWPNYLIKEEFQSNTWPKSANHLLLSILDGGEIHPKFTIIRYGLYYEVLPELIDSKNKNMSHNRCPLTFFYNTNGN